MSDLIQDHLSENQYWMQQAIDLARRGQYSTKPNPNVGCVIVKDGKIIGEGFHPKAGQPHAEVFALRQAGENAKDATAYVTLEPCSHFGRTGPCCDALLRAGIKRVVAAQEDPNPKVCGQGFARLRAGGVQVEVGLCEAEARRLNEHFLRWVTTRRPFVSLKYAMTLDGKLATAAGDGQQVTGREAHVEAHYLRKIHDAILVGIGTVLADDPELTTRLVQGKNPVRIVLDSQARIPLTAQVLQGGTTTIIVVGPEAPAAKLELLAKLPEVEVLTLPAPAGKLDLGKLLDILGERKLTSLLVEGGSQVHGSFVDAGLVDRIYAFIAPKVVGGAAALPPIGGTGLAAMAPGLPVAVDATRVLGKDFLITGRVTAGEV